MGSFVSRVKEINFLVYPFLFTSLSYSVGFLVGVGSTSSLYANMVGVNDAIPEIWAGALLGVVILALLTLISDRHWLAALSSAGGFLAWTFACFMFMLEGNYIILGAVGLSNLYFWIYYYFRARDERPSEQTGLIQDSSW